MELTLPSGAEHLPAHQRRLEAVCQIAMGEPNVLGMLIGGSFASGEADMYSDLDMQFVVEEEAGGATAEQLRRMAENAGPVVAAFFAEHVGLPHMLIVLYRDLIHADFEPVPSTADARQFAQESRTFRLVSGGEAVLCVASQGTTADRANRPG